MRPLFVVPGRAEGADPESITAACVYGFRARRFAASGMAKMNGEDFLTI